MPIVIGQKKKGGFLSDLAGGLAKATQRDKEMERLKMILRAREKARREAMVAQALSQTQSQIAGIFQEKSRAEMAAKEAMRRDAAAMERTKYTTDAAMERTQYGVDARTAIHGQDSAIRQAEAERRKAADESVAQGRKAAAKEAQERKIYDRLSDAYGETNVLDAYQEMQESEGRISGMEEEELASLSPEAITTMQAQAQAAAQEQQEIAVAEQAVEQGLARTTQEAMQRGFEWGYSVETEAKRTNIDNQMSVVAQNEKLSAPQKAEVMGRLEAKKAASPRILKPKQLSYAEQFQKSSHDAGDFLVMPKDYKTQMKAKDSRMSFQDFDTVVWSRLQRKHDPQITGAPIPDGAYAEMAEEVSYQERVRNMTPQEQAAEKQRKMQEAQQAQQQQGAAAAQQAPPPPQPQATPEQEASAQLAQIKDSTGGLPYSQWPAEAKQAAQAPVKVLLEAILSKPVLTPEEQEMLRGLMEIEKDANH